jgi:tRNA A-37 threonylcarbamoyl transferase component Bud32
MLANGARLGPYQILDLLGRGGMGEVYRALDGRLGRHVAIKVLPPEVARDPESLARFRREARAVAALSHPNILAIFDVGDADGTPYVVTELLHGETLRDRLMRGALPLDEMLRVSTAIGDALAAAHAKGIVHRDLKPENVFLTTTGGVKILDFGLAWFQPAETGDTISRALTQPGLVVGTVGYMSPEQLRGQPLTPASDVFSFGCVAYEMLCGRMPFERDSNMEVIAAVLRDDPLERASEAMPREVRTLIERCLAKEAAKRIADGAALAAALREVTHAHAGGMLSTAQTLRVPRWRGVLSNRALWFSAAVLLLAAIAAVTSMWIASRSAVIDNGYDLRASDVTGTSDTRRLLALALRADAAGDRGEAIELCREATMRDARAPLPPAFLAWFTYFNGDRRGGAHESALARQRLGNASSPYEALLCRYLRPENDSTTAMALASSLLELRPRAWRLRLSLAHRHLDRREMEAMLAQLRQIDVSQPDDRRLAIVLADRASLGDVAGALRDLQRSRLRSRPALFAYTQGRIAWSRGRATEAARFYQTAAETATLRNLGAVADDARVLAGIALIGAGQLDAAQTALDVAALKARQLGITEDELEALAFGGYVAWRRGDGDGMQRRLRTAAALAEPGTTDFASLKLITLRLHADVPMAAWTDRDIDGDSHAGVASLIAAREAFTRGDAASALRLLQQARAEGVDAGWFAEEAALLAHDLGQPSRAFRPDPPYPNRLRFIAVWELAR